MNIERATLEKIAPTISEAIAKGLEELGLSEDQVDVEILDEGGRGLLGFGGRQARVRLTVKERDASPETKPKPKQTAPRKRAAVVDDDVENTIAVARETVAELLEKMDVRAEVTSDLGESDEPNVQPPIVVDINGNDLSILIGRRAQTLNALQYITRLIVGKEVGHGVHIVVDVEGYRVRREQSLRQLARRMAAQAINAGRTQVLEPMAPNERRIIHLELRENPEVYTESVGEEPRRKVTIIPK